MLLLRLEGPLQSWGTRSRWSRRDTGLEPTKSAIIGLLGSAAGIAMPDWRTSQQQERTLELWDEELRFGVRVDRPGLIEVDYQSVQGHHWQADGKMKTAASKSGAQRERALSELPHTEITWREYIHDAAFLVALLGEQTLLHKIRSHLLDPQWPLFLGRKSCVPSRPVLDRLAYEYADLDHALNSEAWSTPQQIRQRPSRSLTDRLAPASELTAWIEDPNGDYERPDAIRLNQLRFYDFRRCRRVQVPTAELAWSIA